MANPYDITNKYGIEHPLLKKLNKNKEEDPIEKLNSQIGNYQTRLSAMNQPIPEPKDNTNAFLKVLGWLDKPRNAVWNALEDSVKGENGFFEGLKQGWTGEERYEGTDLMEDLGVNNKYVKGIGGFLAEAIADPLNLLTLGTGSFAKGALTGTAKTLGREGAEALTKATLKGISKVRASS